MNFKIPRNWPKDAQAFARAAISENRELKFALKAALEDVIQMRSLLVHAQAENRDLKEKLGTNSTNSGSPPSKDPPNTPAKETRPTGKKQGAQKGHPGFGRKLFPPERVNRTQEVFPQVCPVSKRVLKPEELVSLSVKRVQQVDLPEGIQLLVTEFRLHTCRCPCGCGKTLTASMPTEFGNTAVGPRLKALMALLASRYRLSKTLIREILIDQFGPDAAFSRGCISEAEEEISESLKKPYEEAKAAAQKAPAAHVDETSWFLKHKLQWLWVAVTNALTVFYIDPNRSRAAFERFLGHFEGFIISDRFSAYTKLSPANRQLCWAHLTRDFRKLVDRHGGAEGIGKWALGEIEVMFELWHLYLDGEIDQAKLRKEFATIRARFGRLLDLGQETSDKKAAKFCKNLHNLWPALWNFLQRPDIIQPTNNRAEQGVRPAVIGRALSYGSQSDRGLRFTERMLTTVATLRRQSRKVLDFLHRALLSFRGIGVPPSLLPEPSG